MMIGFVLIAALLLCAALAFVIPPLVRKRVGVDEVSHDQTNLAIYRDQLKELEAEHTKGDITAEQYRQSRTEIERRVLEEVRGEDDKKALAKAHRSLAVALAVLLPLVAVPLYLVIGTPGAIAPQAKLAAKAGSQHEVSPEMINAMVEQLAQKLKTKPDDPEGWQMLAKSNAVLGRYKEAAAAYAEATKRSPPDAQLFADYADTLALVNGRRLAGEPERLIARALEIDPRNPKALALAGTVAFEARDYQRAAQTWRRILESVPPESELGQRITASIADAEAKAGGAPAVRPTPAAAANASSANPPAATAAAVSGSVQLSDAARASVGADDVVFVFARAPSGSRMPIAIQRLKVRDLPYEFKLDDSTAMAPNVKLSTAGEIVVGARVSRAGTAMPAAGDWESDLIPAKAGASGLRLQIARQIN